MCRRRVSQDKGTRVVSNIGDATLPTASALLSSLCSHKGECAQRAWFDKSETLSIAVQNKGGEFFHSMGRVSKVATISSLPSSTGNMRPSFGASEGQRPIL